MGSDNFKNPFQSLLCMAKSDDMSQKNTQGSDIYTIGSQVSHIQFGPGVILKRESYGQYWKLEVEFSDKMYGTRQISSRFVSPITETPDLIVIQPQDVEPVVEEWDIEEEILKQEIEEKKDEYKTGKDLPDEKENEEEWNLDYVDPEVSEKLESEFSRPKEIIEIDVPSQEVSIFNVSEISSLDFINRAKDEIEIGIKGRVKDVNDSLCFKLYETTVFLEVKCAPESTLDGSYLERLKRSSVHGTIVTVFGKYSFEDLEKRLSFTKIEFG